MATSSDRLALCLSGGGYRAALFHLGAVRRLNELGVLSKIDTISSVSGGSILAAHLATTVTPWPEPGKSLDQKQWQVQVEAPFRQFVKRNIRTWPVLKRLFPWNWCRSSTQVKALESTYFKHLTKMNLTDLPDRPNFVFCGTDITNGVSWVFEKRRVGSYRAGYVVPAPAWPVARAVACSSCFPPIFDPMPMPSEKTVVDGLDEPKEPWKGITVSDGGLYDNLGIQPAFLEGTILVSDGGEPFVASTPKDVFARLNAYVEILSNRVGALRVNDLIARYTAGNKCGTYWGVASARKSYRPDDSTGYSKALATEVIAQIRTDMDAFSDAEVFVLMNHGYLLADIAIEVHAPNLKSAGAPSVSPPFPDWLDDEARVRGALAHSHERWWLGHNG